MGSHLRDSGGPFSENLGLNMPILERKGPNSNYIEEREPDDRCERVLSSVLSSAHPSQLPVESGSR